MLKFLILVCKNVSNFYIEIVIYYFNSFSKALAFNIVLDINSPL